MMPAVLRSPGLGAGLLLALLLLPRSSAAEVLDLAVAASHDDAEETGAGSMLLASGDLALGEDGSPQSVGLRFTGVAIPPEHVVTAAWLQFRTDETGSASAALWIEGEAAASAAPFGRATGDISGRPRTAEAVPWSPPAWTSVGAAGPAQRTPDLAPVLQEIVDGPGWASGNALVLILTGSGRRVADSFDGGFAPQLHVEFEPASDGPPELSLTSPADGAVYAAGEPIAFAASASDAEDGDLSAAVLFESDLDGPLGSGPTLVRSDLSTGDHRITASVSDSAGNAAAASIQLLVTPGAMRILAAGDIASCGYPRDEQTAALLDGLDGLVLTLGDNVYPSGTAAQYADCYEPSWGRHKARTRPAAGNHDYETPGAAGYFGYFGAAAGDPDEGWYSFDYGGWHLVALNSNCAEIGGCGRTSPQGLWLEADLDAHPSRCTLAYWHHPRFSSSSGHGSSTLTRALWQILEEHGADVVLVGHDHGYERFAPQDADGAADPLGPRQFVVGTGGASLYPMGTPEPNSELRNATSYGVISLALAPGSYAWTFHPIAGQTFTDSGSASCVSFAPQLNVTSPSDGAVFAWGEPIAFAGAASDVEEGNLGARLVWRSSRDGEIGTGSAFTSSNLSCGDHLVTVTVEDLHAERDEETLALEVAAAGGCPPPPPSCGLGPELALLLPLLGAGARRAGGPSRRV